MRVLKIFLITFIFILFEVISVFAWDRLTSPPIYYKSKVPAYIHIENLGGITIIKIIPQTEKWEIYIGGNGFRWHVYRDGIYREYYPPTGFYLYHNPFYRHGIYRDWWLRGSRHGHWWIRGFYKDCP